MKKLLLIFLTLNIFTFIENLTAGPSDPTGGGSGGGILSVPSAGPSDPTGGGTGGGTM